MSLHDNDGEELKPADGVDDPVDGQHDVYSTIELVTSCDGESQEEIPGPVEDDLLDDGCVSHDDDYIISVLSHENDAGYIVTEDAQQITNVNGQLVQNYIDSRSAHADSGLGAVGQQAFILNLPYSVETTLPVIDDDELHDRPVKRFRLETAEGYDVILAVAGDEDELVQQALMSSDGGECDDSRTGCALFDKNCEDVNQAWFTTRDDKLALQNKGHKWKQGQWTKEEIDLLTVNIDSYCQKRGINDPADIIFHMSKDERKDFYRSVAKGIERPLFSVYRRVIRMYDEKNYHGKYSSEELMQLRELRKRHGSDWAAIGAVLGRSASSVKDRCRLMKETCNTGKWFAEEELKLSEAVYQLSGANPGESVTSGLSWAQVAEHVGTRSEKQCRTKWLNYLNWKQKGGSEWTREDDLLLLAKLAETNATEEGTINWQALADQWPSVRSPQWLRGKWWSMKRHIKDYHNIPFQALLQAVQTAHIQNVVRLPQYFMTVSATKPGKTETIAAATASSTHNSTVVTSGEQFNLSQVLPPGSIMFNVSNLNTHSTESLTVGHLPNGRVSSNSASFGCSSLVSSRRQAPVLVARASSQQSLVNVAPANDNMSELVTSQTLFIDGSQKCNEVDDSCLDAEENAANHLSQDVDHNCEVIQQDLQDFRNHFASLEDNRIEIGVEEDESADVEHQTGLILKAEQMGCDIEIMPLDDSYTEVIAEDLEIHSTGDEITLVCSASNDGDSVPCFTDTMLTSDSAADLL